MNGKDCFLKIGIAWRIDIIPHMDSKIQELQERITAFRDARDWKQFHNPKDMALSLVLEATEVMEHFQWKSKEEMDLYLQTNGKDVGEELADVLYWVLLMGYDF